MTQEPNNASSNAPLDAMREGMSVEVLASNNQVIFLGKVDKIEDASIQIVSSSGQNLPPILYNAEVKLRGFVSASQTLICFGRICGSTDQFWKIDQLFIQHIQNHRNFFRQKVSIDATILRVNGVQAVRSGVKPGSASQGVPCKLLDISGGGTHISCLEIYQPGDLLFVTEAKLIPGSEPFSFNCKVQRADTEERTRFYGCEFEGLPPKEQDRLVQTIFLFQRRETQRRLVADDM